MPGEKNNLIEDTKFELITKSLTKGAFYAIPLTVILVGAFNFLAYAGVEWTALNFSIVAAAAYVISFAVTGGGSYYFSRRAITNANLRGVSYDDDNEPNEESELLSHAALPRPRPNRTNLATRVALSNVAATVVAAGSSALNCESTAYTIAALMAASNDSNDPMVRQRAYVDALYQARLFISLFCVIGAYAGFNTDYVLNLFLSCCQSKDESAVSVIADAAAPANYGTASSSAAANAGVPSSPADPVAPAEVVRAQTAIDAIAGSLKIAEGHLQAGETSLLEISGVVSSNTSTATGIRNALKDAPANIRQQAKLAEAAKARAIAATNIDEARQAAEAAVAAAAKAKEFEDLAKKQAEEIAALKPASAASSSSSSSSAATTAATTASTSTTTTTTTPTLPPKGADAAAMAARLQRLDLGGGGDTILIRTPKKTDGGETGVDDDGSVMATTAATATTTSGYHGSAGTSSSTTTTSATDLFSEAVVKPGELFPGNNDAAATSTTPTTTSITMGLSASSGSSE